MEKMSTEQTRAKMKNLAAELADLEYRAIVVIEFARPTVRQFLEGDESKYLEPRKDLSPEEFELLKRYRFAFEKISSALESIQKSRSVYGELLMLAEEALAKRAVS